MAIGKLQEGGSVYIVFPYRRIFADVIVYIFAH